MLALPPPGLKVRVARGDSPLESVGCVTNAEVLAPRRANAPPRIPDQAFSVLHSERTAPVVSNEPKPKPTRLAGMKRTHAPLSAGLGEADAAKSKLSTGLASQRDLEFLSSIEVAGSRVRPWG
jgi:hypothetical protein